MRERCGRARRGAHDRQGAGKKERTDAFAQLTGGACFRHDLPRIIVHEKRIEIRWRDLDGFNHVNNAVYLTYLEEARDEWIEHALGPDAASDFVVARVAIDFRRELTQEDDEVIARCGLERVGTSSVTTREEVFTVAGALAAEAEAVLVARDRESARSRPLSAEERAALERAP